MIEIRLSIRFILSVCSNRNSSLLIFFGLQKGTVIHLPAQGFEFSSPGYYY